MKDRLIGLANVRRSSNECVKHSVYLCIRAAYYLEHIAHCRLILERFFEVISPSVQLAEQPRVLHGDDRLRREVFDQRDLLVRKRSDLTANYDDDPQQHVLFAERNAQPRANTGPLQAIPGVLIVAICRRLPNVSDMHDPLAADYRVEQTENAHRAKLLQLLDDVPIVAAGRGISG